MVIPQAVKHFLKSQAIQDEMDVYDIWIRFKKEYTIISGGWF